MPACHCIPCSGFLCREEEDGQWKEEQKLEAHSDWVRDVAWAPSIGLPTSTIASCSQVCHTTHVLSPDSIFNRGKLHQKGEGGEQTSSDQGRDQVRPVYSEMGQK